MTDGRFPLLRLPQQDILRVVKSMGFLELLTFSLSSKQTKSLVESAGLKTRYGTSIEIYNGFRVEVSTPFYCRSRWYFYEDEIQNRQPDEPPMKLTAPKTVRLWVLGNHDVEINSMQMELKDWVDHIKSIFHCPIVREFDLYEDNVGFDIDSVKNAIGEPEYVYIGTSGTEEQNLEKMKAFGMRKQLYLGRYVWQTGKPPANILIRNFDNLEIGSTTMTFDDVSLKNSKFSTARKSTLTEKDINRYLKLWMRGRVGWNVERMCFERAGENEAVIYLEIRYYEPAVLEGIDLKKVEKSRKRWFKPSNQTTSYPVSGGYDIKRKDGTTATITFGNFGLELTVWHSYCIGNEEWDEGDSDDEVSEDEVSDGE